MGELDPRAGETSSPAWKQEVNQRLAAHRNRRGGAQDAANGQSPENPRTASGRAAEAAARVAARYAKAPSYSQLLAGEARAVVRAAGVAAEAARNAQVAAQAVLAGLESRPEGEGFWEPEERQRATDSHPIEPAAPPRWQDEPPVAAIAPKHESPRAGAQPRWEEALPVPPGGGRDVWSKMRVHPTPESARDYRRDPAQQYKKHYPAAETELFPQDVYDSYGSLDAMASATVEPVQHLPANLIEFPRELTATRKARPRLAEGPFYDASHENSQLSIFEVDPDLLAPPIMLGSAAAEAVAPPGWASIELDHPAEPHYAEHHYTEHAFVDAAHLESHHAETLTRGARVGVEFAQAGVPVAYGARAARLETPLAARVSPAEEGARAARNAAPASSKAAAVELLVAPFSDRMLATVVDGALVTLAFLAAAVVVIASTAHPPTGRIALIASTCGVLIFWLLYQFLFLSYAEEGTPGMRYARIALCTFEDDNPTREQMRRRIPAMLLSAAPAGLGLLWALFDRDHLGWHDRLTKTYQRKY
jgi:uncharacterized RDD family membrane protein YckC